MLQMGLLARVAGDPARLRRLSCRFAGMVRPGDTVSFRATESGDQVELGAVNQDGQPVLTRASAELRPPEVEVVRSRHHPAADTKHLKETAMFDLSSRVAV